MMETSPTGAERRFEPLTFVFPICFGFRASDFGFLRRVHHLNRFCEE
jgi:hypothetical protein